MIADMKESTRVLIALGIAFSTVLNVTGDLAAAALVACGDA